ncbi:unnamed protein product [Pneumocystis jirovecii]|uniref:Uncharacterized protein n=1 Tax=Pneumocystis jirovecii TaxID=42068 RepID=L0P8E0_PNEJI|nr:unnamed protein product [Pneumocystis jirovecii]
MKDFRYTRFIFFDIAFLHPKSFVFAVEILPFSDVDSLYLLKDIGTNRFSEQFNAITLLLIKPVNVFICSIEIFVIFSRKILNSFSNI